MPGLFSMFKKSRPIEKSQARRPPFEAECVVCLETGLCIATSTCSHAICLECLGNFITTTHQSRLPCPCPSSAICSGKFTVDDIEPFVGHANLYRIWLLQADEQIRNGLGMYCPNRACLKPILWTAKIAKKRYAVGKCRSCGERICIRCKVAYHDNLTYDLT